MRDSYPYDPELHEAGSPAARGYCSYHDRDSVEPRDGCAGEPTVSFMDASDQWQSGCSTALEELVERGEIAPLGQGA
jgi:hypothetical protein